MYVWIFQMKIFLLYWTAHEIRWTDEKEVMDMNIGMNFNKETEEWQI